MSVSRVRRATPDAAPGRACDLERAERRGHAAVSRGWRQGRRDLDGRRDQAVVLGGVADGDAQAVRRAGGRARTCAARGRGP